MFHGVTSSIGSRLTGHSISAIVPNGSSAYLILQANYVSSTDMAHFDFERSLHRVTTRGDSLFM